MSYKKLGVDMKISNAKTFVKVFTLGAILAAPAVSLAGYKDTVIDRNGNVLQDSRGGCVLTKWVSGYEKCPSKASKPVHVIQKKPKKIASVKKSEIYNLNKESKTVYFDFNSTKLTNNAKKKLNSLISLIQRSKEVANVEIIGYADRIGSSAYNKSLSQKRSSVVQDYFTSQGYLKTTTLTVMGIGEAASVTNCSDELNRDKLISCLKNDRRVEIKIRFYN